MKNKKIEINVPVWLLVVLLLFGFIFGIFYNRLRGRPKKTDRSTGISNAGIMTPNASYLTRKSGMDPNSDFWNLWGEKINIHQAKHKLAFNLVLPDNNNETIGRLTKIIAESVSAESESKEKSRVAVLFYSNGVKIMESFLDRIPPTRLKDYKNKTEYEQIKKEFISIDINGIEGIAGKPASVKNSNGVIELKPGVVTWYKKPLLYTVYGNGKIPLTKLIKIARLL